MGECGMCVSLFEAATTHLLDSEVPDAYGESSAVLSMSADGAERNPEGAAIKQMFIKSSEDSLFPDNQISGIFKFPDSSTLHPGDTPMSPFELEKQDENAGNAGNTRTGMKSNMMNASSLHMDAARTQRTSSRENDLPHYYESDHGHVEQGQLSLSLNVVPSLLQAVMEEAKAEGDEGFVLEPLPLPIHVVTKSLPAIDDPMHLASVTSISSRSRNSSIDDSPEGFSKGGSSVSSRLAWEAVKQRARSRNAATLDDAVEPESSLLVLASPFMSPSKPRVSVSREHQETRQKSASVELDEDYFDSLQDPVVPLTLLNHPSTESDETDLMQELIDRHGDTSE